ncbi:MAG: hypothetical protein KF686_03555 [Ramlibacter sp.]|nr:hypothetical protein [Ramlibacter sp.]
MKLTQDDRALADQFAGRPEDLPLAPVPSASEEYERHHRANDRCALDWQMGHQDELSRINGGM